MASNKSRVFHRPDDELRKAMAAIEGAKIEWAKRSTSEDRPAEQPLPKPTQAARLFGFGATSPHLRQVIAGEVDSMLNEQHLEERNGRLYLKVND